MWEKVPLCETLIYRSLIPFYSKERAAPKVISLLPSICRPPLLQRPSRRRCEEGSLASRRVDLYSCSFLLLACSSSCLGLGLLLLISGGGGGLGAFSGGSQEPFGPLPHVRRKREVGMAFFVCVQKRSFPPSWGSFGAYVAVVTGLLSSMRLKTATLNHCYHCQCRSVAVDVHSSC
jgi:hypothetical protein